MLNALKWSLCLFVKILWIKFSLQYLLIVLFLLFSHSVMSNSLQPHGLQYTRPPCPSPSSEVCPSSCPLHRWCYSAISSYDAFFSCPHSSNQSLFQWVSFSHLVMKYWSFSFSISTSNEYSGLISLKIEWFDLLAVQGTWTLLY